MPRTPLTTASVRAYLDRDWSGMRVAKREHWRSRVVRDGLGEAIRATDQMRVWMTGAQPGWPSKHDREEDLETHRRVAQALLKTARPATHAEAGTPARRVR